MNDHRIWWVQAETVIGFLNEYQKHPQKTKFLEASEAEWEFIKEHVIDKRTGSSGSGKYIGRQSDCGPSNRRTLEMSVS